MNLPFTLSVIGLILNALASFLLVFTLWRSNKTIDQVSSTRLITGTYGDNPALREELKKNRKVALIAFIGLLLGFLCQLVSQFWECIIS